MKCEPSPVPGSIAGKACRRLATPAGGFSLVEILVAMVLIGFVFSAVASGLTGSVKAVTSNERMLVATGMANDAVEELRSLPWHVTGLYEGDPDRIDAFEGLATVTLPDDLDERVPAAVSARVHDGVAYTISRFITWADLDGNGYDDAKRLTVIVAYRDATMAPHQLRVDTDRYPTAAEAPSGSGRLRVLHYSVLPDPAELEPANGTTIQPIEISVRFNRPATDAAIEYVGADANGQSDPRSVTLQPDGDDWTVWTYRIRAGSEAFFNGDTGFVLNASDTLTGANVNATATVSMRGGPFSPPDCIAACDPAEDVPDLAPVDVRSVTPAPNPVCVGPDWRLTYDLTVDVVVSGIGDGDTVTVTYPYWSESNRSKWPDQTATETATWVRSDGDTEVYRMTVLAGASTRHFKANQDVKFTAQAHRAVDGGNDAADSAATQIATCR